jgi:hypothetical protein
MLKTATAYLRKGRVILGPMSVTTAGVGINVEPFSNVGTEDIVELGKRVLQSLEASRQGVPHPRQDQWKGLLEPMLNAAGVKSWGAFAKTAKQVDIQFDTNRVSFYPRKNLGPRHGFGSLPTEKVRTCDPTDIEVGAVLLSAFEDAE